MALTYTSAAIQEHAKIIEENIAALTANLTNRHAVSDYAAYSFLTGKIEGLRMALELCDEAVRRLNES